MMHQDKKNFINQYHPSTLDHQQLPMFNPQQLAQDDYYNYLQSQDITPSHKKMSVGKIISQGTESLERSQKSGEESKIFA